jgi:rhodanese-related sulfurtransferase
VSSQSQTQSPPVSKARGKSILLESLLVAVTGLVFALMANQVSPRGIKLPDNYFPGTTITTTGGTNVMTGTNAPATGIQKLIEQLKANGLQVVVSNQVFELYQDPRKAQELVVFIDARDDKHFGEGHIPGAYQLDHYRKENYLGTVLPVCMTAEQIVVYCTGGDCEDSQFTAITLRDAGIGNEKLLVYAGGMQEWSSLGYPVEMGPRNSGILRTNALPGAPTGGGAK